MRDTQPSPLRALILGAAAGVIGTAAMTAHQEIAARLQRSNESAKDGETEGQQEQEHQDPWDSAPAPAKVGKKIIEGVFDRDVSPDRIGLLANVMHWLTGVSWGGVYGLVGGTFDPSPTVAGPAFGAGVWAASYVELVPMGIYEPPWKYSVGTIANDVGYHLTYGIGVASAFALLRKL